MKPPAAPHLRLVEDLDEHESGVHTGVLVWLSDPPPSRRERRALAAAHARALGHPCVQPRRQPVD